MSSTSKDDTTYLKLLSSQRELLSNLNHPRANQSITTIAGGHGLLSNALHGENTWQDSLIQPQQHYQELFPRRSSLDMLLSRRLSICMGYDGGVIIQTIPSYNETDAPLLDEEWIHSLTQNDFDLEWSEASNYKKRRLSESTNYSMLLSDERVRRNSLELSVLLENTDDTGIKVADQCLSTTEEPLSKALDAIVSNTAILTPGPGKDDKIRKLLTVNALETLQTAMIQSDSSWQSICKSDFTTGLALLLGKKMQRSSLSRKKLCKLFPSASADGCSSA
jgi:hypothetical protein